LGKGKHIGKKERVEKKLFSAQCIGGNQVTESSASWPSHGFVFFILRL